MTYSHILRFSRQMERYYNACFDELTERTGVTMNEIRVLLFLTNNPDCDTARDVVELRGLSKSQVSQAVEQLSRRGLLERCPDSADRRIVHLTITEAGLPLAREAQQIQTDCGRQLLEGFSREEMAQLKTLFEKMVANGTRLAGKEERK